jgi:hypothetical protein
LDAAFSPPVSGVLFTPNPHAVCVLGALKIFPTAILLKPSLSGFDLPNFRARGLGAVAVASANARIN